MSLDPFSKIEVPNLFDSHVHWLATGDVLLGFNLKGIKSFFDLEPNKWRPNHKDWIVGFGWDQNLFRDPAEIHRKKLDLICPNHPVFLSRTDGHASLLNTMALIALGWLTRQESENPRPNHQNNQQNDFHPNSNPQNSNELNQNFLNRNFLHGAKEKWNEGKIKQYEPFLVKDSDGIPTGLINEKAHIDALTQLPQPTDEAIEKRLLAAQDYFLSAGFTHIRDMTSNKAIWSIAFNLEQNQKLRLHVDYFFVVENLIDFNSKLEELMQISRTKSTQLIPKGIKIFFDGSLGSETALIKNRQNQVLGQQLWSLIDLKLIIKKTWQSGFEIAIHTLGDEAVDRVARVARELSSEGITGILNLEHVEVIRPETLKILKPLHVRVHMQPCHWFTDQNFLLKNKNVDLKQCFSWSILEKNNIPVFLGSDSPIEPPDFIRNLEAIKDLERKKIPGLLNPIKCHQYPKSEIDSTSIFENGHLKEIIFNKKY